MTDDADLIAEQRTFYRLRAPAYDDWWQRRGRYDRGAADAAQWQSEVDEVARALGAMGGVEHTLELAGGTGWWSAPLAQLSAYLTVVDSSPEALALNRQRVPGNHVSRVVADLFGWEPRHPRGYDLVFFSFWLSHVPRSRFEEFWGLVGRYLAPNGRVFLIDNAHDPTATSTDPYVVNHDNDVQRRQLDDGSLHRVVKVFYEPDDLMALLRAAGWQADLRKTAHRFVYGTATRIRP